MSENKKKWFNYFSKFGVKTQLHDIEAVTGALSCDRVEGHGSSKTGEVDAEQVREDGVAVNPRHERVTVALNASCLVVEHLTAAERPSKHVRVVN